MLSVDVEADGLRVGRRAARHRDRLDALANRIEAAVRKTVTVDGVRTGDIAVMNEDGSFRIVDRLKDMIIVSGQKVFPNEVEDVLVTHPKIREAAVIGVPDKNFGEGVCAYIVPGDDSLTEEEVRALCREQLAGYTVPRRIEFVGELPKSSVGKILRRELRAKEDSAET
jgi:long-chain acyl-CoA synthetase